jgi:hypothetical protein
MTMDKKYLIASVLSLVLLFGVGIAWVSAANNDSVSGNSNNSGSADFKRPELGRQKVGGCGCGCDGSAETCPAGAIKRGLEFKAEKLGLSVEELQALLDSGKTMIQIAEEKGIELADLRPDFGKRRGGGCGCGGGAGNCSLSPEVTN